MNKTGKGTFKKGEVHNPGGRPKTPEECKLKINAKMPEAIDVLADLLASPIPAIRLAAAKEFLDRGLGKSVQSVDMKTEVSAPISISFDGDLDKWSK